ncbi:MAG: invasion associated locus B family protein [Cardiobacteriaceae bacterium]|nr:invasion associated locus B family protein [Cardiobacteriaceae bacterium]
MSIKKIIFGGLFCASFTAISALAAVKEGDKFGDWTASCQKDACVVGQLVNINGQPAGRMMIQKSKDDKAPYIAFITLRLDLGVNLMQGLGLGIDGKEVGRAPFEFCHEEGCNVFLPLDDKILGKLKSGNKLQLQFFTGGPDKRITVDFSLSGITKAVEAL